MASVKESLRNSCAATEHAQPLTTRRDRIIGNHQVSRSIKDYNLSRFALGKRVEELYESMIREAGQPLSSTLGLTLAPVRFGSELPSQKSKLVVVEPAPGNCDLLKRNCAGTDYELLAGGLCSEDGTMYLMDPGNGDWAFRVVDQGSIAIPVFSACKLVDVQIDQRTLPFICKIDIEGGEDHLFKKDSDWIDRFPLLIVELHDYMLPGGSRSRGFLGCIARYNFDVVPYRENIFCFDNRLPPVNHHKIFPFRLTRENRTSFT